MNKKSVNRREFIKGAAVSSVAVSLLPKVALGNYRKNSKMRIGVIGTGLRGQWHIKLALRREDVEIPVICDIDEQMIGMALSVYDAAERPQPKIYKNGKKDYQNLLQKEDLDGVIIATPWHWHAPMAVSAMESGKHVGVEGPAGLTEN